MEQQTTAPIAQPAAAATPAIPAGVTVTPVNPAPAAALPAMPDNKFSEGGSIGFMRSFNWIELGFMALGAAGLFYTIHYYRYKLKEDKTAVSDLHRKLDEHEMNIRTVLKSKYQTI